MADSMDGYEEIKRGWKGNGAAPRSRLQLIYFNDIVPQLDHLDFVEGLLCSAAMSLVFGASGCGKTHEVVDLGLHVALEWPWRGREVERGGVIYVCGEGGHGISNRIAAFRKHHGIEDQNVPFAVIPSTVNLLDPNADTGILIEIVRLAAERMGVAVVLVIVDTLSRALVGGDENSPEAMGALVANADRIREATRAHLMFVHHSGKNAAAGARGHSILRAATDTEIEITKNAATGIATAKVTKQRELPTEGEWSFRLVPIELGLNHRGKPVTACVALATDEKPGAAKSKVKLVAASQIALKALREALAEGGEIPTASNHIPANRKAVKADLWRKFAYARNISQGAQDAKRMAFSRASQDLQAKGQIGAWDEWVWLPEGSGQ